MWRTIKKKKRYRYRNHNDKSENCKIRKRQDQININARQNTYANSFKAFPSLKKILNVKSRLLLLYEEKWKLFLPRHSSRYQSHFRFGLTNDKWKKTKLLDIYKKYSEKIYRISTDVSWKNLQMHFSSDCSAEARCHYRSYQVCRKQCYNQNNSQNLPFSSPMNSKPTTKSFSLT